LHATRGSVSKSGDLLKSDTLKKELEVLLPSACRTVQIVSAYVTSPAMDWFGGLINKGVSTALVCRLNPKDVVSGATSLPALKRALELGWDVYCLHSLHAKIYCIDDSHLFVGSNNFTGNGLKIFGSGNLEACVKAPASPDNLDFINEIISSSIKIDLLTLEKMQKFCDESNYGDAVEVGSWPEEVLEADDGIWVQDFFWLNPVYRSQSEELTHDLDLLGLEDLSVSAYSKERVLRSRCVQWLISLLMDAPKNELYFGAITQALHSDMKDDPSPYRKEIKGLLQNLLTYAQLFLQSEIEISRPNYSQKVRLINKVDNI